MLKTAVLLNIIVETLIIFFQARSKEQVFFTDLFEQ